MLNVLNTELGRPRTGIVGTACGAVHEKKLVGVVQLRGDPRTLRRRNLTSGQRNCA
jgi:hypothetical protein